MDFQFWSRLCYYYSKLSRSKHNNQLTRKTPSCLAIAVVSNARFLGYSSGTSPNHSKRRGNNGDERRSTLQCGAQDLDSSSYQVSDLEDIEFNWENSQLDMDVVFRPGMETPFSPTTSDDLSMGGSVEYPIVLDEEEEDKENFLQPTLESVRPMEPPRPQRSHPFGTRIGNLPDCFYRNLFQ